MKHGTLPEIVPRRRLVINSWVCEKYSSSNWNNSFVLRCWVVACNGNAGDCNNWRINKVSIVSTDWILWVVTLWRKILTIFEDMRNMVYGRLCILRVVVPCKNHWPLEKIRILHWVDFGQNEYEFCLDMCDAPRVCGMKLETISCLDQMWSRSQKRMLSWFEIDWR